MKAIQVRATGGPEVLELRELPDPVPHSGEALIRVHTSGVNFMDVYFREGKYKAPLPFIPGGEGSGHVEVLGDGVADLSVGDAVAWLGSVGSYDGVGQSTFEQSLKCLRRRGLLALYGAASGPVPPFDLLRLSTMGSLFITRPISLDYIRTRDELTSVTSSVFSMFTSGQLNVLISRVYSLENASESHRDLESRKTTGKLLLSTGS